MGLKAKREGSAKVPSKPSLELSMNADDEIEIDITYGSNGGLTPHALQIEKRELPALDFTRITDTYPNLPASFTDEATVEDTTYEYRAKTISCKGESEYSDVESITTPLRTVWDESTAVNIAINELRATGVNLPTSYNQRVRSIRTINPATGGGEFKYRIHDTGINGGDRSIAGLGTDPFANPNSTAEFQSIEHGFHHPVNGRLFIFESGTNVRSVGNWQQDDIFKITIDSQGTIRYYQNDELVHTSTVVAVGDYYLHYTPIGRESIEYVQ